MQSSVQFDREKRVFISQSLKNIHFFTNLSKFLTTVYTSKYQLQHTEIKIFCSNPTGTAAKSFKSRKAGFSNVG
uniref:Uncharacterized protein n=1 Tax=Romanomermis culicivorax TaxID=13658 RepID=A0A915JF18_ROMCU